MAGEQSTVEVDGVDGSRKKRAREDNGVSRVGSIGGSQPSPTVKLGEHVYEVGCGKVAELRDSTDLRGNGELLRRRLDEDGYVFLRGVVPQDVVAHARSVVLEHMDSQGLVNRSRPLDEALVANTHAGDQGRLKGAETVARKEGFLSAVEHGNLFDLFGEVFGKGCMTFDQKWLRAVSPGESSGFHMDSVYMSRGSSSLLTCWVPLGDVPWELGGLAVLRGSHRSKEYSRIRETYGKLDLDKDDVGGTGWLTEDPEEALQFGGVFETAHFRPGDVVFFGLHTLHGSAVNRTDRWRISCDVRFQPACEPADARWLVDPATGEIPGMRSRWAMHRDDPSFFPRTMEDAKRAWGISASANADNFPK
eukprot:TRINITY_DN68825_c0_g1_i1.p1 TRINITY_DN68825_c0_g1~~TRINITY_DN68825_c0_g1_i1.p1  ORF type:complete len:391 (-),score=68.68 TRINITY_DN68825_c0_g1_i1:20-1108(-)